MKLESPRPSSGPFRVTAASRFGHLKLLALAVIAFATYTWYSSDSTVTASTFLRYGTLSKEAVYSGYSGADFLPSLAVLGHALSKHAPGRDKNLFVLDSLELEANEQRVLETVGWRIMRVGALPLPGKPATARYATGLLKLNILNQTQYDQVAIIDADTMVLGNLGPAFAQLELSGNPVAVAADRVKVKTKDSDPIRGRFNAGVMFVRPSSEDYDNVAQLSSNASFYDVNYADQSLLNNYFLGDWLGLDLSWNLLTVMTKMPEYWGKFRPKARIIHFAGNTKPWHTCAVAPQGKGCLTPSDDFKIWRRLFAEVYNLYNFRVADFSRGLTPEDNHYDVADILAWVEANSK